MKIIQSNQKNILCNSKGNSSLFVLLTLGGIAVGFGMGFFFANKNRATQITKQEDVVAVYNGTGITAQDAYFSIKNRVYEIESSLYEMKRKAILDHIQSKLLEEEAKKSKMSIPSLIAKNLGGEVSEPTNDDVTNYMLSKGLNPKDRKIKREDIKNFLKYRATAEKREAYLEKLASEANIKLLIPEPSENIVTLTLDGYAKWGNNNAPVTVVEYSDFPCANCARNTENMERLKKEFGPDKVKIVFAENPTPSNPRAYPSAIAARCANDQGKFWEMRELLFQNPHKLEDKNLKDYAKTIGIDTQKFNSCLDSKQYSEQIEKSKQQAVKMGILALPSLIVNGTLIQGNQPYEKLKQKVESQLKPRG